MARRRDRTGPLSHDALLRYQVVSLVRARLLAGWSRAAAVTDVAATEHATPSGELCRFSARSVYRWLAAYERGGAGALEEQPRRAEAASRVLEERLLRFLQEGRAADEEASIPELLRRAEEAGVVRSARDVDRSTVFRALVRLGVPTGRVKRARGRDARRFAYEHRMELVLADGKHFRAGAARNKRVAYFFLDDATRLGLGVVVGTSESAQLFLRGFHAVLRAHGRMGVLYLDHGPGFVATSVAEVCRRLEIALVHGEARYPEGHGKVERFNQTAGKALLRALDGRADVDPACEALELRLRHYLLEVYNHTPHESLRPA
ncbi:MAG: helix-turn-helix domain-containing protein [Burkholderiales bacterium]